MVTLKLFAARNNQTRRLQDVGTFASADEAKAHAVETFETFAGRYGLLSARLGDGDLGIHYYFVVAENGVERGLKA
jgi:hypothetical protein